jgi:hypothetical protein
VKATKSVPLSHEEQTRGRENRAASLTSARRVGGGIQATGALRRPAPSRRRAARHARRLGSKQKPARHGAHVTPRVIEPRPRNEMRRRARRGSSPEDGRISSPGTGQGGRRAGPGRLGPPCQRDGEGHGGASPSGMGGGKGVYICPPCASAGWL